MKKKLILVTDFEVCNFPEHLKKGSCPNLTKGECANLIKAAQQDGESYLMHGTI